MSVSSRITIDCPPPTSETGAFRVSWDGPDGAVYRVVENDQVIYEGTATATTVTGREAGTYAYSVAVAGETSESCTVEVAPPSLALAFALFSVGLVVFACTLALVLAGHRAHRREAG